MARPLRLELPGGIYHITARGNERKLIYRDDIDRTRFQETLAQVPPGRPMLAPEFDCLQACQPSQAEGASVKMSVSDSGRDDAR